MNNKTIAEIKGKYSELIDCLNPNRSSYAPDVAKLTQDCANELSAKYDTLTAEINEAAKDYAFVFKVQENTDFDTWLLDVPRFNSGEINELIPILRPNE